MIQELLGGGLAEDGNKICISGGLLGAVTDGPSSCSSPTSATSSGAATAATTTSTAATNSEQQQNLRCPRCDSTNTKFCYYNNYNLTQPRHFCKTCRRYWTKGGALRNVPIGGGCRKTKSNSISVAGAGKSAGSCGSKAKILASEVITGKSGLVSLGVGCGGAAGFDNETTSSSVLWGSPQNSHLLALLRATERSGTNNTYSGSINTIPNPSPCINPNLVRMKEEGPIIGSHLVPEASLLRNALNARVLGVDPLAQVPLGLSSSLWSNQYQYQLPQQQQQQAQQDSGFLLGEAPSSGALQELYLRLRSSGNGHYADHTAVVSGNVGTSSSSSSTIPLSAAAATTTTATTAATILEQTGVAGGEFGYWNSPFAWADMPTSNGAFL